MDDKPTRQQKFRASIVAARLLGKPDPRILFKPAMTRIIITSRISEGHWHAQNIHHWQRDEYKIITHARYLYGLQGPFEIHFENEGAINWREMTEIEARINIWHDTNKIMRCQK